MDQIINAIGVLGAYFAVLLVIAVSIESILDSVKILNPEGIGAVLRQKISPEQVASDLKQWLPEGDKNAHAQVLAIENLIEKYKVDSKKVEASAKTLEGIAKPLVESITPGAALQAAEAQFVSQLFAIRDKVEADETRRIALVRLLAAIIGMFIAVFLQIDTFQLLAALFPKTFLDFLSSGSILATITHYGGMLLTGLAASAGSGFWHDQLGKLRAAKELAQQATGAVKEVAQETAIPVIKIQQIP